MLPVMEKILPLIYNLLEVFMNLPESVKLAIGTFVLFAATFGKILLVVGQVMLAVTALGMIGGIFIVAIAAVSLFIPLMGILIGYFTNLEKNTKSARDQLVKFGIDGEIIDNIIQMAKKGFFWLMDFFPKLKEKIFEWFDSLWQGFKSKLPAMLDGMVNLLKRVWDWLVDNIPRFIKMGGDLLMSLVDGILRNIDKITNAITFLIDKIVNWISKNIDKIINAALQIVLAIAKGITNNIDKIIEAIFTAIKEITRWVKNNTRTVAKIGLELAWGIIKGLWRGLGDLAGDLVDWLIGGGKKPKKSSLRMYQTGGLVANTGPAILHRGERVIPKNRVNREGITFSPTVVMTASINNEMDVRILAENLNRYWSRDFERLLKGRGSY
ncbi:MAG: phage tail protein [Candidatus Heimdallarchaeota archaeon]